MKNIGWVRVTFSYWMKNNDIKYILYAIKQILIDYKTYSEMYAYIDGKYINKKKEIKYNILENIYKPKTVICSV